jgi:thiamine biosynthesis protein ThiI
MDKEEITADAQRIGTYGISIVPDEDCCSLFTPKYPATGATLEAAERAERGIDVAGLVASAVEAAEIEDMGFPRLRAKARQTAGDHA